MHDAVFMGGKGKGHPRTDHEGQDGEKRYNSVSLSSALDGVGG